MALSHQGIQEHQNLLNISAVLVLNKMSLWDFSSAFTDKYYQVHVLIPHPLMPTSPAGDWCWVGATSCSVLRHWTFSQANPYTCLNSALTKYSTSASTVCHSYTQIAEYTWAAPVGTSGAEGGMWRIWKVFPGLEDYLFQKRHPMLQGRDVW